MFARTSLITKYLRDMFGWLPLALGLMMLMFAIGIPLAFVSAFLQGVVWPFVKPVVLKVCLFVLRLFLWP